MSFKTISEIIAALQSKTISSLEITQHYLERIKQYNPTINALISVTEEQALAQARIADERIAKGTADRLTGVPIIHKDNFCIKDTKTTCASKMLSNFTSPYDATVVEKLKKAGMVVLGKANMDEFAMGASNETSFYGPVSNPWDTERVPGGSSGGSAAAVAAGLSLCATGTDTGGSIRQPAALCNLVGVKPTYGRVSRYGIVSFASSLDQAGPITRTAEDAADLLYSMSGVDERDATSADYPVHHYREHLKQSIKGLTIGIPKEFFESDLNAEVAQRLEEAMRVYQKLGAQIKEVSLKNTHQGITLYYLIASAECASNLARYDGVHYGYRCADPKDLEDLYQRSRSEGLGPEVKRRLLVGTHVLSSNAYAYYLKAQTVRTLLIQEFAKVFETVDVLLGPTTPSPAFKFNEKMDDPMHMYLSDIYTVPVSLAGLPAVSLPAGFINGLPVGQQLIGPAFSESRLLNIAHQYQQITDWHTHTPGGF